jgi:hypothetical protein
MLVLRSSWKGVIYTYHNYKSSNFQDAVMHTNDIKQLSTSYGYIEVRTNTFIKVCTFPMKLNLLE